MFKLFSTSKTTSDLINGIKTVLYSAIFWIVFLFVIPLQLKKVDPQLATGFVAEEYIGSVLFLFASAINVWAGYTMSQLGKGTPLPLDCPNRLVVQGPYRYVRNPMAIGGISQGVSVGVFPGFRPGCHFMLYQVPSSGIFL